MSYIEGLLAESESVILATRQHAVVLFRSAVKYLVVALVALVVSIVFGPVLSTAANPAPVLMVVPFLLLLIPVGGFLRDYAAWLSEEYCLTDRRVIQSEGIINKHVIDSSLEKVNDIVMRQSFLGRLLDYADIQVLTGSEAGINFLKMMPQPMRFKTMMLDQKEAFGQSRLPFSPGDLASAIPALIAQLDALRRQGILTETEFQQKKAELLARM